MITEETTDKLGYDLLSQYQPALIEAIKAALREGATANQVEANVFTKFDLNSITVSLAIGATHWLERNPDD